LTRGAKARDSCGFLALIVAKGGDSDAALHGLEIASLLTPHGAACSGQVAATPAELDGISRALYVAAVEKRVVIVRVFIKKTQKTPGREITLALARAKEIGE